MVVDVGFFKKLDTIFIWLIVLYYLIKNKGIFLKK